MRKSPESKEKIITAQDLALRRLPKGWAGGTLEQLSHSAEKVIEQSKVGTESESSGDSRFSAAKRILELKERLKERPKKQVD